MTDASNPIEAVRARLDGGRRWHKGSWGDGGDSVCILGAAQELRVMDRLNGICDVIAEQFPDRDVVTAGNPRPSIPKFNDHPDTIWADVDLVLDKASVRWDEQVR